MDRLRSVLSLLCKVQTLQTRRDEKENGVEQMLVRSWQSSFDKELWNLHTYFIVSFTNVLKAISNRHAWCYGMDNGDQDDDYFDDYPDSAVENDKRPARQKRAAPEPLVQYNSVTFQVRGNVFLNPYLLHLSG